MLDNLLVKTFVLLCKNMFKTMSRAHEFGNKYHSAPGRRFRKKINVFQSTQFVRGLIHTYKNNFIHNTYLIVDMMINF